MISRRFNPYLFRHFNPCFKQFESTNVSFLTPISTTSQPIYRRRFNPCKTFFTGNKCENCPIKTVYNLWIRCSTWLDMTRYFTNMQFAYHIYMIRVIKGNSYYNSLIRLWLLLFNRLMSLWFDSKHQTKLWEASANSLRQSEH